MKRNSFKFIVQSVQYEEKRGFRKYPIICVKNLHNDLTKVHPYTDFIMSFYNGREYNTMYKPAMDVCRFLNWLNEYRFIGNISDLSFSHGKDFLDYLFVCGSSRQTIKDAIRHLTAFYDFLHTRKLLPDYMKIEKYKNNNNSIVRISPFGDVDLPSQKQSFKRELYDFPSHEYVIEFLETALEVAPKIALGIYLQIYGGLRKGEVVNLSKDALHLKGSFGSKGLIVDILDRPELFYKTNSSSGKEGVKVPRRQPIQITQQFKKIYKKHIGFLSEIKGNIQNALFLNSRNKAITGDVYERHFENVKKAFIMKLEKSPNFNDNNFAGTLKKHSWGTHIGRRIYSNMMAKIVKSPNELAILRGDKNLTSALSYLSKLQIDKEVNEGLKMMYENAIKNFESKNNEFKEKFGNLLDDSTSKERIRISEELFTERV